MGTVCCTGQCAQPALFIEYYGCVHPPHSFFFFAQRCKNASDAVLRVYLVVHERYVELYVC